MSADDAMSVDERAFEESLESLEEEVFKKEPAVRKTVRKTVQEVLGEPIPREMEKHTPMRPEPYEPRPRRPQRRRKTRKMREILREFEPAPKWWTSNVPGRRDELQDLYSGM